MEDLLTRIVADAAIIAAVGGVITALLRKWLSTAIDTRFKLQIEETKGLIKEQLEVNKALLEVYKIKQIRNDEQKDSLYAELLELVYRLRNDGRNLISKYRQLLGEPPIGLNNIYRWSYLSVSERSNLNNLMKRWSENLYLLTEQLYKYRALIDNTTFEQLHTYKRELQDAGVLIDRISRDPDSSSDGVRKKRYQESASRLEGIFRTIDSLYEQITKSVHQQIEGRIKPKHSSNNADDILEGLITAPE